MKTIEELKGMATEDLVRYAQEMQETLDYSLKDKEYWFEACQTQKKKYETFKMAVKSVLSLTEQP